MPHDLVATFRSDHALARLPGQWKQPLAFLAIAWLGLLILFFRDWADMAGQWWNSSTYNHILLVPVIVAWLIKLRARELAELTPSAWWPGLFLLAGALFVWLLGAVSGLNLASQLGAVLVLQASAITLLGPRVAAGLLFPFAYMLFLVPIGDSLVPALQLVTAKLTIFLTELSGVPAHIEGVFIDTPAGLFEVAEACSGVKFLIAMIALGALVSHLCFKRWTRRALFMALAVALPIFANGVRAWGTIFIAQSQGVEFAAGFDHIFYGWVFFALVMATLLGAGWRFFDRPHNDDFVNAGALRSSPFLARLCALRIDGRLAMGLAAFLSAAAFGWAVRANSIEAELSPTFAFPHVDGWERVEPSWKIAWEPRASGADRRLLGHFRNSPGHEVDVFAAAYSSQGDGKEAGAFGEGALVPDTNWRWTGPQPGFEDGAGSLLQANGSIHRVAVTWYRTGGLTTGANYRLKIANMANRLTFAEAPTMTLIISAQARPGSDPEEAIAAFLASIGPVGPWMDDIAHLD